MHGSIFVATNISSTLKSILDQEYPIFANLPTQKHDDKFFLSKSIRLAKIARNLLKKYFGFYSVA